MTYEYLCTACGHGWEAEQSISASALTTCPQCHAESAKRQVSGGAGFILKGGGWYSDLYASAPKKSGGDGDAKPDAKPSTDATTKKEGGSADTAAKSTDKGSSGSGGAGSSGSGSGSGSGGTSGSSSGGAGGTPAASTSGGSKTAGASSSG